MYCVSPSKRTNKDPKIENGLRFSYWNTYAMGLRVAQDLALKDVRVPLRPGPGCTPTRCRSRPCVCSTPMCCRPSRLRAPRSQCSVTTGESSAGGQTPIPASCSCNSRRSSIARALTGSRQRSWQPVSRGKTRTDSPHNRGHTGSRSLALYKAVFEKKEQISGLQKRRRQESQQAR